MKPFYFLFLSALFPEYSLAQSNPPIISAISDSKPQTWSSGFEVVDNDATITDSDSASFANGALLVRVARGSTTDEISIASEPVAGKIYVVGRLLYLDKKVVGSLPIPTPVIGSGFLRINFRSNVTPEVATKILRSITYRNNSSVETIGNRTLQFKVLDGGGGASVFYSKVIVLAYPDRLPTRSNMAYGPHERNKLDFWQAPGDTPRPLIVFIHGGGWFSSDKSLMKLPVSEFLANGISCAKINYRYSTNAPLPAPVHDAARAIQFLRSQAGSLNIDADRIALSGTSAGGCSALWILFHDDIADPTSSDPVLRQSSRVYAAAVNVAQTSISPIELDRWIGPLAVEHPMIHLSVGAPSVADLRTNLPSYARTMLEFSPIHHLDSRDPPVFLTYGSDITLPATNTNHAIHHPMFGQKLKEKSNQIGHECHLLIPGVVGSETYSDGNAFLLSKLLSR